MFIAQNIFFLFQVMNLIGDVKGKVAVMVDDMIDTAGKSSLNFRNPGIYYMNKLQGLCPKNE